MYTNEFVDFSRPETVPVEGAKRFSVADFPSARGEIVRLRKFSNNQGFEIVSYTCPAST